LKVTSQRFAALAINGVSDAVGGDGVIAFGEEEGGEEGGNARVSHGGYQQVFSKVLDDVRFFLEDRVD